MEYVPRSVTVTQAELQGKTTIEMAPDSEQAQIYMHLAQKIAEHEVSRVPNPMEVEELRDWASHWSEQLTAVEMATHLVK